MVKIKVLKHRLQNDFVHRFRSLRTPGNLLVANLALSDVMLAITGFPLYAISSFYGRWAFSAEGTCLVHFLLLKLNKMVMLSHSNISFICTLLTAKTGMLQCRLLSEPIKVQFKCLNPDISGK